MIAIADLESFLGLTSGTDTDLLIALEAAAVDLVENVTHRYFGAATSTTEYQYGNGQRNLYLQEVPTSVSMVYQSYAGATQTALASSDSDGWEIRAQHLTRKGGYLWDPFYEYVVDYTKGYTLTASAASGTPADIAAPDDIRQAVKLIVARWYNGGSPQGVAGGLKSERIGDYSYQLAADGGVTVLSEIPGLDTILMNYHQANV